MCVGLSLPGVYQLHSIQILLVFEVQLEQYIERREQSRCVALGPALFLGTKRMLYQTDRL